MIFTADLIYLKSAVFFGDWLKIIAVTILTNLKFFNN